MASLDNNTLIQHLEESEKSSLIKEEFYFSSCNQSGPLGNIIFKAKTQQGVLLMIYNYMKEHNIPLFCGGQKGNLLIGVSDIISAAPFTDLTTFDQRCAMYIDDCFIRYNQIISV